MAEPEVPWFPTKLSDLDKSGKVLTKGLDFEDVDHPSFKDQDYYQRRIDIAMASEKYRMGDPSIPIIDYTNNENYVWGVVYDHLFELYKTHACKEFNDSILEFQKYADFKRDKVP